MRDAVARGPPGVLGLPADRGVRGARPGERAGDASSGSARSWRGCASGWSTAACPAEQKAQTMAAFKAGEIDVLVATTVIEVGVDVPNASLMVIEHAERFGLSQLHQLRGRVGRGAHQSVCVLLYRHPAGAGRQAAADHHVRNQRRLRDRPPRPGPARPGRVPRRAPVRRAAAAVRRPRAGRGPGGGGAGRGRR